MWTRWVRFFREDLWNFPLDELEGSKRLFFRWLRIFSYSVRNFITGKNGQKASSLTYYSLMSIVPMIAMMFAIARGFGYQEHLRKELFEKFAEQKAAITEIINFADRLLSQTSGGILATAGIAVLFWSVTSLLSSMEHTLNFIWGVQKLRSWKRIITDYFSLILLAPFVFVLSSSATVLIAADIKIFIHHLPIGEWAISALSFLIGFFPYVIFWMFFTFIYYFLPNTKVKLPSAFKGGLVAGSLYVAAQLIYIYFQIGVNRYGAIYGSFAALPLFLLWLQASWFILLFGAQVSFAHQTLDAHEYEPAVAQISPGFKKIVMLWIAQLAVDRFLQGEKPITLDWIVHHCRLPISLAAPLIQELVACNLLYELKSGAYVPSRAPRSIRISDVLIAIESKGQSEFPFLLSDEIAPFEESLRTFADLIAGSSSNALLSEMNRGRHSV